METIRIKALNWWFKLSLEEKFYELIPWLKKSGIDVTSKHPDVLAGSEIESVYLYSLQMKSEERTEQQLGYKDMLTGREAYYLALENKDKVSKLKIENLFYCIRRAAEQGQFKLSLDKYVLTQAEMNVFTTLGYSFNQGYIQWHL